VNLEVKMRGIDAVRGAHRADELAAQHLLASRNLIVEVSVKGHRRSEFRCSK